MSSNDGDFAVHMTTTGMSGKSQPSKVLSPALKDTTNTNTNSSASSTSPKTSPQLLPHSSSPPSHISAIILYQVLFDLLVNCTCIFSYSFSLQLIKESVSSMLNFSSLLVVCSFLFLLLGLLGYCTVRND
jgi:hypothetical protein